MTSVDTADLGWSSAGGGAPLDNVDAVLTWIASSSNETQVDVRQVGLDDIDPWFTDPSTGDIAHPSGHFFQVTGLRAAPDPDLQASWSQPIINQPEIGILGFLAARVAGRLWVLAQAKAEPGNRNGVQLSPTVQATWSNYVGVHGGSSVPYLSHFIGTSGRVLVDVLQSEQAAWFYQKRNRNIVVMIEDPADIEVLPGFRWVSLENLYRCLTYHDLVNMDARTVLSCLPLHTIGGWVEPEPESDDRLAAAARRSLDPNSTPRTPYEEVLSWITDYRSRPAADASLIPLREVGDGWRRTLSRISHRDSGHFEIVGVHVKARGREVREWRQPLLAPSQDGVATGLVAVLDDTLHMLVQIAPSPGYRDGVELGPTHHSPSDMAYGEADRPSPLPLDLADGETEHVVFESMLSEEGGRFWKARTRYRLVEIPGSALADPPRGFSWLTLHQLGSLIQHSHYVNVEARTLTAAAHSLIVGSIGPDR